MAHNLARWTARIGLGQQIVTTKTLRRRVLALAGRIARSPQPLQAAIGAPKSACRPPTNLPSNRIRARIIAPVTPSPLPLSSRHPSLPIGGFGLNPDMNRKDWRAMRKPCLTYLHWTAN